VQPFPETRYPIYFQIFTPPETNDDASNEEIHSNVDPEVKTSSSIYSLTKLLHHETPYFLLFFPDVLTHQFVPGLNLKSTFHSYERP
jgi:hypothetical protein